MATLRPVPHNPLVQQLNLADKAGPQPSERTKQFLRVYGLTESLKGDPQKLLEKVQAITDRDVTAEKVYALAELSYIEAKRVEATDPETAINYYGASVLQSYNYLFDDRFREFRNPYDPHFRNACDLYNSALEGGLRHVCKQQGLTPGKPYSIRTTAGAWNVTCVVRGSEWHNEDFGKIEFVADYKINGLKNHYQSYGLGVPLIAVRKNYAGEPSAARYYPEGLSFPLTAFFRPAQSAEESLSSRGGVSRGAVLELYDPLTTTDIPVNGVRVPLESDLSVPLAYFLSNPLMDDLANEGLFHPEKLLTAGRGNGSTPIMGLYMVQPYEPGKIPVLFVHGLWSSPMTWMEMFNDLRSVPEIRQHYQFWFYLYPTAQPFWMSASMLRRDLAESRQLLDPQHREPSLDQMVLIGHSMGGLVSRLQTVPSNANYWQLASSKPLAEIKANDDTKQRLSECFFFEPNPSIRRVVTIATPHRGSSFSNQTTQWLANKLLHLPQMTMSLLLQGQASLFRDNSDCIDSRSILHIDTSIDSLSPTSPIFPVMLASPHVPWVKYHNIVGVLPQQGILGKFASGGDGVVKYESAHMTDVASEITVPADHTTIHTHPLAVLEVRRILLEQLAELRGSPDGGSAQTAKAVPAINAADVSVPTAFGSSTGVSAVR
jgi:pimeloyl-ACP methyl ester carboxylesterase